MKYPIRPPITRDGITMQQSASGTVRVTLRNGNIKTLIGSNPILDGSTFDGFLRAALRPVDSKRHVFGDAARYAENIAYGMKAGR